MDDTRLLERITTDPRVMGGRPVIRGTRLTVQFILGLLASGATFDEVLDEYEGLAPDDIRACLAFAEAAVGNITFLPLVEAAA